MPKIQLRYKPRPAPRQPKPIVKPKYLQLKAHECCRTVNLKPLLLTDFAVVCSFLPFAQTFTTITSLARRTRVTILQKYKQMPGRTIDLHLDGTTKLLKKMPKHVA